MRSLLFATIGLMALLGCGGVTTVEHGTGGAGGSTGTIATGSTSSTGTGTGGSLAAGQCRGQSDCTSPDDCLAPGAFGGCGICSNPAETCTSDADCQAQGASLICAAVECTCMGQKTCAPGCTSDAMCATGEACSATFHCEPQPCGAGATCPTNFACSGGSEPTCQRVVCTTDAACEGYCVDGACYDTPGTCTPPVV